MTLLAPHPTRIARSFRDLPDSFSESENQASVIARMGGAGALGWSELLKSSRILLISEAGTGKTYECRAEQFARWESGEAAFYFELAELARSNPREMMSIAEEERFDAWLISQSDVATFFLDSVDELKLTLGSFESALKRLGKTLAGQLGRVRIVITARPIPIDRRLIETHLPIPKKVEAVASAEAFADTMMNREQRRREQNPAEDSAAWKSVALLPLTDEQILEMAQAQGVGDARALLSDIRQRNAQDFARRPQDLIELCADWLDHHRIRTHREQVASNISIKLKPRTEGKEMADLSPVRAEEGSGRLALALLLTRKLTLRHNPEADHGGEPGTALNVDDILLDWSTSERRTLLERPLFGFASYGRVRFHHRSVIEYLAAGRLESLLEQGMSIKALKRILFAETAQGIGVIRPSMRPVAAWLAITQPSIYSQIREREPGVLFDHGDPESLSPRQRIDILRAYVNRYRNGGWRGMRVPHIQVHRFASAELASDVLSMWRSGIENTEVRELLLDLISAVPMPKGADLAYAIATTPDESLGERLSALEILIKLSDPRVDAITHSMATEPGKWSERLIKSVIPPLFPSQLSVERLCDLLSHTQHQRRSVDSLSWQWQPLIANSDIVPGYLEELCVRLTSLVLEGAQWAKEWAPISAPKHHLVGPLATACLRLLKAGEASAALIRSCVVAVRLGRDEFGRDEPGELLRNFLASSSALLREAVFWSEDAFVQEWHPQDDPWKRLYQVMHKGSIKLSAAQDAEWLLSALVDVRRSASERAVALEAAMQYGWNEQGERRSHLLELRSRVASDPALSARIDEFLAPSKTKAVIRRMEAAERKRSKQAERRQAKSHASWVLFWKEVAQSPQTAFSPDRAGHTAWNLWQAMQRSGEESRASGWNRRFIEKNFSKSVADQLRLAMQPIWRNDKPTLRSERSDEEKNTFLIRWQLGLAAVAAEAEDKDWARKLSVDEAEIAARYAPLELNGFPSWLESLCAVHPAAIDKVLGTELSIELDEFVGPNAHSILLQNIDHAPDIVVAVFLPRLGTWLRTAARQVSVPASSHQRRVAPFMLAGAGPDDLGRRIA